MMEAHTTYNRQKAETVCFSKPTRAAACETKQPPLSCPFFSLSRVVGKVASKFAIKMATRTIAVVLRNPFETFKLVYNGRNGRPFICNAVSQGWMKVLHF